MLVAPLIQGWTPPAPAGWTGGRGRPTPYSAPIYSGGEHQYYTTFSINDAEFVDVIHTNGGFKPIAVEKGLIKVSSIKTTTLNLNK